MMRAIYLSFNLWLLGSLGAQGASWYVDNAAAGSGTGSSWANAWKSFSTINWSVVNPGDTIFISGGTPYQAYGDTLKFGKSGTSASRITVKIGQDPGHNGIALLNGNYVDASGMSYVSVSGNYNGENHFALTDFFDSVNRTLANKVYADGSTGFLIEYCNFTNVNQCVSLVGASGFNVRYCKGTDIRGDAAVRAVNSPDNGFDSHFVEHNFFEMSYCTNIAGYLGPDGVQGSHGLTVRYNTFTVKKVGYQTSTQHPDYTQLIGNHLKIYGNEFLNIGDSGNDFDWWCNPTPHDILIYNNVYHITAPVDPYPEYIRWYASAGSSVTSISNFVIANNTFVDNTGWANLLCTWGAAGNPTLSGWVIANNLFLNGGAYSIADNPQINGNSLGFSHNLYSPKYTLTYRGSNYTPSSWTAVEPTSKAGVPAFVSYAAGSTANDFHLGSTDTVARGAGVDLSAYFTIDKDGNPRSGTWDIGAYASGSSSSAPTAPVVSAGQNATVTLPANTATLTGTVSNPSGGTLTVAWSQVSGPAAVTFSTPGSLNTQATFSTTGTYSLRLTAAANGLSASSDVTVTVSQPAITVSAGLNQSITLPVNSVTLNGSASSSSGGSLTLAWSEVSGPASATFTSPALAITQATFPVAGSYLLRLTASTGNVSTSSDVTITVVQPLPTVNAGVSVSITLPVNLVMLNGTASNPAGGPLSILWSQLSGPGTVTFSSPGSLTTQASFSAAGAYVLRLTATAGTASASSDVTVTVVQPLPIVSAGPNLSTTMPTNTVTLSGTASNPAGGSVTVAWSQVSGPGTVTFSAPAASTSQVTFPLAGSYTLQLTATAGTLSASATTMVTINPAVNGLSFAATSGVITAPFVVSNGAVSQPVQTTSVVSSGRAAYSFVIADSGNYVVDVLLNAPSDASNSLFFNIDDEPVDPTMIWDIPITNGFELRQGAWRGSGTFDANEFVPKTFSLKAGTHTLIIRGRESNVQFQQITLERQGGKPKPPSGLHYVSQ